jgi:type IV pilus assembly protein PilV
MKHPLPPSVHCHNAQGARQRQRGISLLESMIALVVSVLGIMGILGMQMRTLADSQTATRRAQAVRLIEDLSERMRVHPNARDGLMRYMPAGTTIVSDFDDTPDPEDCIGNHPSCVLFANELATWKGSVENILRLGDAASVFLAPWEDATAPTQIGIMVSWRANESADMTEDDLSNLDTTKVRNADNDAWISATGEDGVECPDGRICHLQYITVAARCVRNKDDSKIYCPGRQS